MPVPPALYKDFRLRSSFDSRLRIIVRNEVIGGSQDECIHIHADYKRQHKHSAVKKNPLHARSLAPIFCDDNACCALR